MIGILFAFLALAAQPPGSETIEVIGRDMAGVENYEKIIRGTCDGQPASFTIVTATRERPGRLVLRGGSFARHLPPTFLDGSLVTNGLYWTGLACDGRRVQLSAMAIRDEGDEIVLVRQNAVLDLDTGEITLRGLRRFSPAETRSELTDGRDITIDANGRLNIP